MILNSLLKLDRKAIMANFNRCAKDYDRYALLQREIAERLMDRLEFVNLQPATIIDIGSRTGYSTQLLQKRYPQARIIAIDWAQKLLHQQKIFPSKICGSLDQLPLFSESAELVVVNLAWHWLDNPLAGLKEWRRLLKPGGLLLLSTCGPDTFLELRHSFAQVDDFPHIHSFLDMHDIGDILMGAGFTDPVVQAERLCFTYSSLSKIFRDLKNTGAVNALQARRRSLTGKIRWRKMLSEYEKFMTAEKDYPVTFEVVSGLAWIPEFYNGPNRGGEITVPLSQIRRKDNG